MKEFELLESIYQGNAALPSRVTIPPGDDMGELRLFSGARVLVTVDQVADGRHFVLSRTALELVARKVIGRNISDAAAMAVRPVGCVCAAALPRDFSQERAAQLSKALREEALRHDCPLFGGDVTVWDHPMLLSVTVLAEPWPGVMPVLRSGARPGDVLCVTGALGGSLRTLTGEDAPAGSGGSYTHHLQFSPRVHEARELAQKYHATSMIDISDGLGRDAGHIAQMSGVKLTIDAGRLPCSLAAELMSRDNGRPAWLHGLSDGEDYELCFTLPADDARRLMDDGGRVLGVPVTVIGTVDATDRPGPAVRVVTPEGQAIDGSRQGWEHEG